MFSRLSTLFWFGFTAGLLILGFFYLGLFRIGPANVIRQRQMAVFSPAAVLGAMLLVALPSQALIAYHGDDLNVERHCLMVRIELLFGVWLLAGCALDQIAAWLKARKTGNAGS